MVKFSDQAITFLGQESTVEWFHTMKIPTLDMELIMKLEISGEDDLGDFGFPFLPNV